MQDKTFINLIIEKNRIDAVCELPITVNLRTLLAKENGKVNFLFRQIKMNLLIII